jgi:hypothetical protein
MKMTMNDDLIVPIYVDTNALLDLLASIEGGFSLVEKVTSRTTTSSIKDGSASTEVGTEFGIPNVLSLLKIKLGGSITTNKGKEAGEERETEKYHTYGSLLHRLRVHLETNKLIKRLDTKANVWTTIEPSNFVEIRGIVRPNPMVDSFSRIERLIGIVQLVSSLNFGSVGQNVNTKSSKSQIDKGQLNSIGKFIKGISSDIEKENIRTFIIDLISPLNCTAVALIYTNYLRDQTMTEIAHKEYRLLGKVVRKIEKDSEDSIDLLRGTGLSGVGRDTLNNLLIPFNQLEGMNLPEIKSEVMGPALEIVPIAIFI